MAEMNLDKVAQEYARMHDTVKRRLIICAGTGCIANGSLKLYEEMQKEVQKAGIEIAVELKAEDAREKTLLSKSGCQGFARWVL